MIEVEVEVMDAEEFDKKSPRDDGLIRIFRVLYFISLLLTPTIIGAVVGIPLFVFLLVLQYILYGVINPHFVFKNADRI